MSLFLKPIGVKNLSELNWIAIRVDSKPRGEINRNYIILEDFLHKECGL